MWLCVQYVWTSHTKLKLPLVVHTVSVVSTHDFMHECMIIVLLIVWAHPDRVSDMGALASPSNYGLYLLWLSTVRIKPFIRYS